MSSALRGPRIFHRYHQAQHHRDEKSDREEDVDSIIRSPTRTAVFPSGSKSAPFKTVLARVDHGAQAVENEHTLRHACHRHRFTAEGKSTEDESSTNSTKSFRNISLDGCHEEYVSPLHTDSLSAASSRTIHGVSVPRIQLQPSRVAYRKNESDLHISLAEAETKPTKATPDDDLYTESVQEKTKTAPPSRMRRRRSSHKRSRFVFDGNLSFGSISPSPIFASSPNLMSSSPHSASYPSPIMRSYPTPNTSLSMTPMTSSSMASLTSQSMTPMASPPRTIDSNKSISEDQQQNQERRTPPPTHKEQRIRNKAMLSMQYQTQVFDKMWQQQQQQQQQNQQRSKQLEYDWPSRQRTW